MAVLYRSISRDFFSNADIADLSPLARLLYVATWLEADRDGRLAWSPRTLKLRYLANDACDINELAGELVRAGFVVPYEADGKALAFLPGFALFQSINGREAESKLPPPPDDATPSRGDASASRHDASNRARTSTVECNGVEWSGNPSQVGEFPTPPIRTTIGGASVLTVEPFGGRA